MLALLLSPYGAYLGLALLVLYYLLPYLQRSHLRDIPAPGLAAFTNFWVLLQTRRGHRFIAVDNAHKKYGKLVRLAPRHTSIADDGAIQAVYGHGNGFLKSYVPPSSNFFFLFFFLCFLLLSFLDYHWHMEPFFIRS